MKKNYDKLKVAERTISEHQWLEFVQVGVAGLAVIQIDRRLLPAVGGYLPDGEFGVGAELLAHYRTVVARFGPPQENPAQCEMFLGPKRVQVFFCPINGKLYACAEEMMPF